MRRSPQAVWPSFLVKAEQQLSSRRHPSADTRKQLECFLTLYQPRRVREQQQIPQFPTPWEESPQREQCSRIPGSNKALSFSRDEKGGLLLN
jgi:type VI protein secretion system component VasK